MISFDVVPGSLTESLLLAAAERLQLKPINEQLNEGPMNTGQLIVHLNFKFTRDCSNEEFDAVFDDPKFPAKWGNGIDLKSSSNNFKAGQIVKASADASASGARADTLVNFLNKKLKGIATVTTRHWLD